MIKSFADRQTEAFFHKGICPANWRAFRSVAKRKLDQVDQAEKVYDLNLPGHRLEKLTGDRVGQWSIRINRQWRICFKWGDHGPESVEIVDYHD